jgi:hypothetical protein
MNFFFVLPRVQGPLESLKRTVKDRKTVLEDVQTLASEVTTSEICAELSSSEHIEKLDSVISKLQGFKRKVGVNVPST